MLPPDRRSFLTALASFSGLTLVRPSVAAAVSRQARPTSDTWDLSWLDQLKGRHKQVFAIGALRDRLPLHVVVNYLDAHREVYGLAYPDINTVVGIARQAFPINAQDGLWMKYELGRRWELKDPATGEWARRNIYLDAMPAPAGKVVGVKPLQARGTIFWQCNNALNAIVRELAADTGGGQTVEAVRAELIAGFNPGVRLVPAHTMALGLAQEHGCTYEQL
jgi:hypothetical protein